MTNDFEMKRKFLKNFCDYLLPGDSVRKVPSFSDLGLIEDYFEKCDLNLISNIQILHDENIQKIFGSEDLAVGELNRSFNLLLTRSSIELMPILSDLLSLYYSNKIVIASMGLNRSLPFPKGIRLNEMDFDLLIPVVAQGRKYKDVRGGEIEVK